MPRVHGPGSTRRRRRIVSLVGQAGLGSPGWPLGGRPRQESVLAAEFAPWPEPLCRSSIFCPSLSASTSTSPNRPHSTLLLVPLPSFSKISGGVCVALRHAAFLSKLYRSGYHGDGGARVRVVRPNYPRGAGAHIPDASRRDEGPGCAGAGCVARTPATRGACPPSPLCEVQTLPRAMQRGAGRP